MYHQKILDKDMLEMKRISEYEWSNRAHSYQENQWNAAAFSKLTFF